MYILASDFDGTVCHGGIADCDRAAIARFRAAGNRFGIVTGRAFDMADTLRAVALPVDFIIVCNGAGAYDGDGNLLFCDRMENDGVLLDIAAVMAKEGFYVSEVAYLERRTFHGNYPDGDKENGYAPFSDGSPAKLPWFTQANSRCITEDAAAVCTKELNRRFGDKINALQNGVCIDMPPHGVDKGVGVARYAALCGVPAENIFCAGDNCNDLAMLTRFHGCAVSNAREEVKAVCEGVYDGIFAIIDRIMQE